MTDQEIEQYTEAFRQMLRRARDCQFGRIDGEIAKNRVKSLRVLGEIGGIREGKPVATDDN